MVELQFPELANLERERTPSEWEAGLRQLRTHFERLEALEKGNPNYPRKPLTGTAPSDPADRSPELPAAKKFLVDRLQIPAAKVDAMPAAQILMLHISGVNEEMQDEMYRGAYLPLEQATPLLLAADKRLKSLTYAEATRMPIYFVAAIPKVVLAPNRLERRLAALRTIEAMRAYAAAHDGRLPSKLDDITEMPVPADPGTGQPFEYRQSNATATLIAPVLSLATPKTGLRYSLTMKSKD